MDTEDEHGSGGQGQNLHDLQNYLSTFNKEIEPGDDVLSNMDVDAGVGDVSDLYNPTAGNPLQESGEGGVAAQFSSGFYSEQGILDTPLSAGSPQQMVSTGDRDTDNDIATAIKQEVGSMDLDTVQAQIANFGEAQLSQSIGDIQNASISQGLIMTSLGDNLDPSAGKVIRIVSLGEEGQYLSLADGSQMQILNHDLNLSSDALTTGDTALALQGAEAVTASSSSTQASSILSTTGATHMVVGTKGNSSTTLASSSSSGSSTSGLPANTQLVALQSSSDNTQPQLVALPQGTALSAEALQMSGLLSTDGTVSSDLGYQTITIVPSELGQNPDMNYVLIMTAQDGQKNGTQALAQVMDLKQENQGLSEELVEINGEVKRVLRVIPKKFITNTFGTQLMCDYCDYTSPKRYLLTRHMKSHSDERPHKCKKCDRGFKTPASLINHVNTHTGTRPHKCKTCDAAFTTSGELVRHIRYRHTFEKPHRCPNCDYASVELSKLKRHMRSHTGERPYKCPKCPYASPDTYKLKRHLRIHTGEKPYECDICHARFTQSNSLKAHKLIHSGNKPVFQCSLCPTTCGRKTDLKIHINKLHSMGSPLECKKCGQVFSDRYSYKQHVRAHDIDKCFKCEECDFIANTERSFDIHAAIHSGGKKFECDTCHISFNLKQTLDRHKQTCGLGMESGVDSPSSSRDKESTDEQSVDKPPVYKNAVGRPPQQPKGESMFSLDGGGGSSSNSGGPQSSGPPASDTLHKNLLQDIKAGKLGDVPQVVIVHPDGSLEEISSKLPAGDKLNIEDIFSALSNTEKASTSGDNGSRPEVIEKDVSEEENSSTSVAASSKQHKDTELSDADDAEEDHGESSQCEASTQAELESDTDSVEDGVDFAASTSKISGLQKTQSSSSPDTGKETTAQPAGVVDITTPVSDGQSDPLTSILQTATTSATSSSSSLSTILPSSSVDHTPASNPQYVVVKGYTCLNSETGHPTLVNVAVDKESLMKMFASLGTSGDGGMQFLTEDLDPSITIPIEGSQGSVLPVTPVQVGDFGSLSNLSSDTTLNEESHLEHHEHSEHESHGQGHSKHVLTDTNSSDSLKHNLAITTDNRNILRTAANSDVIGKDLPDLSGHDSDSSMHLNHHATDPYGKKSVSPAKVISKSTASFSSLKMSLSNENLNSESFQYSDDLDTGVKISLSDHQLVSNPFLQGEDSSNRVITSESHLTLDEQFTSSDLRVTTSVLISKDTIPDTLSSIAEAHSSEHSDPPFLSSQLIKVEDDSGDEAHTDSISVCEDHSSSVEKQKRLGRKRSVAADPLLVRTGKRVRKAVVKVSM